MAVNSKLRAFFCEMTLVNVFSLGWYGDVYGQFHKDFTS